MNKQSEPLTRTLWFFLSVSMCCLSILFWPQNSFGQAESEQEEGTLEEEQAEEPRESTEPVVTDSILIDFNGNGVLEVDAFGDSITRGTGDFFPPGIEVAEVFHPSGEAGYPLRVENALGIFVSNLGSPGERLTIGGIERFAELIPARRPDVVIISGGANDAILSVNPNFYFRTIQTLINIAEAVGSTPVLMTVTPQCCDRSGIAPGVQAYNAEMRSLSLINDIRLSDVARSFENTCQLSACDLLNIPEGLHPNNEGYNVMGETVAATLLGINLFAPEGPSMLEQALGLPSGSVITQPDPILIADPST